MPDYTTNWWKLDHELVKKNPYIQCGKEKMVSKTIPSISEEKVLLFVLAVCVGSNFKQWSRGIIIRSVYYWSPFQI